MRNHRGLTLLELLVTLAVVSILLGAGLPALQSFVATNSRAVSVNRLVLAIRYARSESITRQRYVTVCKSADAAQCLGSGGSWARGWIVFVNRDRDWPARRDANEPLLRVFDRPPDSISLRANRNAFTLRPLGKYSTNGTLTVCPENPVVQPRAVIVSVTGRPRTSRVQADGDPLDCGA